ncbi:MAG TPA: amidase family protein, partial [Gammaproteobacteria bacterium]|nr:amidase family protein [Gammaproteobacteria bacterium]
MRTKIVVVLLAVLPAGAMSQPAFDVVETTVAEIHAGYAAGTLTARQLVQLYLDRIEAYDRNGPRINSILTLNAAALEEADRLDDAYHAAGLVGPLHGIPVMLKD